MTRNFVGYYLGAAALLVLAISATLTPIASAQQANPDRVYGPTARLPQAGVPGQAGNVNGPQRALPAAPRESMRPFPPLSAVHQKYLDDILKFWEFKSDQIKHYQCEFQRWEYNPTFGPKNDPLTYAKGVLKYAKPDKGLFRVDAVSHYKAPASPTEKPTYVERKGEKGEHWVCDGKNVFEFDSRQQQLRVTPLPAEMQGKAIVDGPLPFLFGAKAEKIKSRYYMRVVTPKTAKGQYWLEAWPKLRSDAQSYKRLEVIIDEESYLPIALQVFAVNYDEKSNPARTVYMFDNRQVNPFINQLNQLNVFHRDFFNPAVPSGWKKVIQRTDAPTAQLNTGAPR